MELMTFDEVLSLLNKNKQVMSVLLGNGFSMAYDKDIFSYNALYTLLTTQEDKLLSKLFGIINTNNFEIVMQQLDTTIALLGELGSDGKIQEEIRYASHSLKNALMKSVQELHPEHVYKIPEEQSAACAKFLKLFLNSGGNIYTTNYDLLLYWVLMRNDDLKPVDGFGRVLLNPVEASVGEKQKWSDLIWGPNQSEQNIHYLHGALHLFDSGTEVVKERYDSKGYILDNINVRLNSGSYPIFVTAGSSEDKLKHIRHNRYLSYCYDQFSTMIGSLVTFGFNFGCYDEHIIDAVNKAAKFGINSDQKLMDIYIGVYTKEDIQHIESIKDKFHTEIRMFDATKANVWGSNFGADEKAVGS